MTMLTTGLLLSKPEAVATGLGTLTCHWHRLDQVQPECFACRGPQQHPGLCRRRPDLRLTACARKLDDNVQVAESQVAAGELVGLLPGWQGRLKHATWQVNGEHKRSDS
jgi:hypothetical protein